MTCCQQWLRCGGCQVHGWLAAAAHALLRWFGYTLQRLCMLGQPGCSNSHARRSTGSHCHKVFDVTAVCHWLCFFAGCNWNLLGRPLTGPAGEVLGKAQTMKYTRVAVVTERSFLAALDGSSCRTPDWRRVGEWPPSVAVAHTGVADNSVGMLWVEHEQLLACHCTPQHQGSSKSPAVFSADLLPACHVLFMFCLPVICTALRV